MSPDQKAQRLARIADQIEGAARLVTAGRMALDGKTAHAGTDALEADALCELMYEVGDRLKAAAENVRAER